MSLSTAVLPKFNRDEIIDPRGLAKQGFKAERELDLVLIQDTTGSLEEYIKTSLACCVEICLTLKESPLVKKDDGLRVALLAFRDHGDEDGYLVKNFGGFTDKVDTIVSHLESLESAGGGDGPEAITPALDEALKLDWREESVKLIILITDAPPHAIGEKDDYFKDGEPGGADPLVIAHEMAKRGIALIVVACEPTLSNNYQFAHDFYTALTQISGGSMLPLMNIAMLAPLIVGSALEQIEIDSLVSWFEGLIKDGCQLGMSEDELATGVYSLMRSKGSKIYTVKSTPVYTEPKDVDQYVLIWTEASDTPSARREYKNRKMKKFPRIPNASRGIRREPGPLTQARIKIRLKNLWSNWVTYSYRENGQEYGETLEGGLIKEKPIEFYVNRSYSFTLLCGTHRKQVSRTFSMEADWDLSQEFQ